MDRPVPDNAVSVVMPVRNGEAYIAEAIASVLDQGPCLHELIVVDDGSTDGTARILGAIPDRRLRLMTAGAGEGGGVSAARNAGLAAARAPFTHFLDADDRLRPGVLAALLARADDAALAVYGDYDRIDAAGRAIGRRGWLKGRQKPSGAILPDLMAGNFIVTGALLVRTQAFRAVGGFDTTLRYGEDWHAWCRLAARGPIRFVPGLHVMDYRVHAKSTVASRPMTLADLMPAIEAVYAEPALGGAFAPAARADLRRKVESRHSAFCISQALRTHHYGAGLKTLVRAGLDDPRALPRLVLVSGAAMAGL